MSNGDLIDLIKGRLFYDYKIDSGEQTHLSLSLRINGKLSRKETIQILIDFLKRQSQKDLEEIINGGRKK